MTGGVCERCKLIIDKDREIEPYAQLDRLGADVRLDLYLWSIELVTSPRSPTSAIC
jgi:hypothetical protein